MTGTLRIGELAPSGDARARGVHGRPSQPLRGNGNQAELKGSDDRFELGRCTEGGHGLPQVLPYRTGIKAGSLGDLGAVEPRRNYWSDRRTSRESATPAVRWSHRTARRV